MNDVIINSHAADLDMSRPHFNEPELWRSVILQALRDALMTIKLPPEHIPPANYSAVIKHAMRDKREAIRWFEKSTVYFPMVCDMAGVDSEAVRAAALSAIQGGRPDMIETLFQWNG